MKKVYFFYYEIKVIIKKISFSVMFSNTNNFFISFELFDKLSLWQLQGLKITMSTIFNVIIIYMYKWS